MVDDTQDHRRAWVWSFDSLLEKEFRDTNGDGSWDEMTDFVYDSDGVLTDERMDQDMDGDVDEIIFYDYRPSQNRVIRHRFHVGANVKMLRIFTWDAGGHMSSEVVEVRRIDLPDMPVTYREIHDYQHQGNYGRGIEIFSYLGCQEQESPVLDFVRTMQFNNDGLMTREQWIDYRAHTPYQQTRWYEHDDLDRLSWQGWDTDGNGEPDYVNSFDFVCP